jgi:Zn-dependent protease with chaperone function
METLAERTLQRSTSSGHARLKLTEIDAGQHERVSVVLLGVNNTSSLLFRSIIAILLLIGFYALALGMAAFLLWLVYLQVVVAGYISIKLALICVVLAGVIVWSVLPRIDHFEPPGPELHEADHPRLFALIRDIAERTGQRMPSEVYLVADVNAFVTQRGGIMGFFSRRIMGLGLPLLSLLTVSQLAAVLAHEFGHYHGGDTKLGPWIYKTRNAIGRTIISLAEGGSTIIRKPFEWYGTMFLRVTHAISRSQELAADALAARVVGAKHLIGGLKAVHAGAPAFQAFLRHEYVPVLNAGYRPPLGAGFRAFVGVKKIKASLDGLIEEQLENPDDDPFDTHPPLARRIEELERFEDDDAETDDSPATDLLDGAEELEAELIRTEDESPLRRLAWSAVAKKVLEPRWQENANRVAAKLGKVKLGELVLPPARLGKLAAQLIEQDLSEVPDAAPNIGAGFVASAVCATLAHAGWSVKNRVGRPITLERGETRLQPFKDFASLADGKLSPKKLGQKLSDAGVAELALHVSAKD